MTYVFTMLFLWSVAYCGPSEPEYVRNSKIKAARYAQFLKGIRIAEEEESLADRRQFFIPPIIIVTSEENEENEWYSLSSSDFDK